MNDSLAETNEGRLHRINQLIETRKKANELENEHLKRTHKELAENRGKIKELRVSNNAKDSNMSSWKKEFIKIEEEMQANDKHIGQLRIQNIQLMCAPNQYEIIEQNQKIDSLQKIVTETHESNKQIQI